MSAPCQKREASPEPLTSEPQKRQKHQSDEASSHVPLVDATSATTTGVTVETSKEEAPRDYVEGSPDRDTEDEPDEGAEFANGEDAKGNPEENTESKAGAEEKVKKRRKWRDSLDRFIVRGNPSGHFTEYLKQRGHNSRPSMSPEERRQLIIDLARETKEQDGQHDTSRAESIFLTSSFAPVDSPEVSAEFLGLDLSNLESIRISPSSGLTLRVDQVQNIAFMVNNAEGLLRGAVNSNESGSGKTIEALSSVFFLAQRREARPGFAAHRATLILCPHQAFKSLQHDDNTQIINPKSVSALTAVLERMEPSDPRTSYTIILATYDDFSGKAFLKERKKEEMRGNKEFSVRGSNMAIEAHEAIEIGQKPILFDLEFEPRILQRIGTLIADEAHEIKNPRTRRAQAAYLVDADIVFLLTASPTDNRISDFRGLLFALFRPTEWRINWPGKATPEEIFSMYRSEFDPFTGKDPAEVIPGPAPASQYVEALRNGKHLWRLNPHAYRWLGNQMLFGPPFSKVVLGSIFRLCVLRRDPESVVDLPGGTKRTITDIVGVPRVTIKTIELNMDDYYQEQNYSRIAEPWFLKLFSTGDTDTKQWNAAHISQTNEVPLSSFNQAANVRLNYVTADIGLVETFRLPQEHRSLLDHPAAEDEFLDTDGIYAGDEDAGMTFYYTMTRRRDDPLEPPPDRVSMIRYLVRRAPKLRWLLVKLDELKQRNEKAVVFCVHPRTQWMIEGVFSMAEFDFYSIRSKHDKDVVRPRLFADFNDPAKRVDFLLTTMEIAGFGADLSRDCHNMIFFELPHSVPMMMSAIGRIHRNGQTKQQEVSILTLANSYDDYTAHRHFRKYSIDLLAQGVLDGFPGRTMVPSQVVAGELVRRRLGARVNRSHIDFRCCPVSVATLRHFGSKRVEVYTEIGRSVVDEIIASRMARAESAESPQDDTASAAADDGSEAGKHPFNEDRFSPGQADLNQNNPVNPESDRSAQQPDKLGP